MAGQVVGVVGAVVLHKLVAGQVVGVHGAVALAADHVVGVVGAEAFHQLLADDLGSVGVSLAMGASESVRSAMEALVHLFSMEVWEDQLQNCWRPWSAGDQPWGAGDQQLLPLMTNSLRDHIVRRACPPSLLFFFIMLVISHVWLQLHQGSPLEPNSCGYV